MIASLVDYFGYNNSSNFGSYFNDSGSTVQMPRIMHTAIMYAKM